MSASFIIKKKQFAVCNQPDEMSCIFKLLLMALIITLSYGRIQNTNGVYVELSDYTNANTPITTSRIFKGGLLQVRLENFIARPIKSDNLFGFSLYSTSDEFSNYVAFGDRCALQENIRSEYYNRAVVYFVLDFVHEIVQVKCGPGWQKQVHIYSSVDNTLFINPGPAACENVAMNLVSFIRANQTYYNTSFVIFEADDSQEAFYSLYFHICPNVAPGSKVYYNFSMTISEENAGRNFCSSGDIFLPAFYFTSAVVYLLLGGSWVFHLKRSRHSVFKIHHALTTLVFLTAAMLAFRGLSCHTIESRGLRFAAWDVLFYVTRLLQSLTFVVTLVLVGTGWSFVKHVLSTRDKFLLTIVVPLNVLANVAAIILEESDSQHEMWRNIFIFADVLCCICLLLPGIWSIRRVRKATHVYGEAAVNLTKVFRWFYVMVVFYVYFTRIVGYLIKVSVPFQYGGVDEIFRHFVVYFFISFLLYKFRPAALNPYSFLPSDDK